MNRLDLIIDALEYSVPKFDLKNQDANWERHNKALVAALELKALKPVAMVDHSHPFSDDSVYMIANYERSLPSGTKLYALEDTK